MQETIKQCKMGGSVQSDGEEPKPLCLAYKQPDKATAIQQHKSQFSLCVNNTYNVCICACMYNV